MAHQHGVVDLLSHNVAGQARQPDAIFLYLSHYLAERSSGEKRRLVYQCHNRARLAIPDAQPLNLQNGRGDAKMSASLIRLWRLD